jgi:hypothetical protein
MLHGTAKQKTLGDDNGCFAAALKFVRDFGGVLEHPEASHAFTYFLLGRPQWREGWKKSADGIGYICCVAQGNYGHRARKLTWLYYVGVRKPADLDWSIPVMQIKLEDSYHSSEERARLRKTGICQRLSSQQRSATPIAFANLLLNLASP